MEEEVGGIKDGLGTQPIVFSIIFHNIAQYSVSHLHGNSPTDTKEQIKDSSENETEADESDNCVPCPNCCKFFRGINGLKKHLKSCDAFKNLR